MKTPAARELRAEPGVGATKGSATDREAAMPERNLARMRKQLRSLRERHAESQAILGIAMAGIAALFIIGIVAAYNYAARTDPQADLMARVPTQVPASAPAKPAPETTGSGGAERPATPQKTAPR